MSGVVKGNELLNNGEFVTEVDMLPVSMATLRQMLSSRRMVTCSWISCRLHLVSGSSPRDGDWYGVHLVGVHGCVFVLVDVEWWHFGDTRYKSALLPGQVLGGANWKPARRP